MMGAVASTMLLAVSTTAQAVPTLLISYDFNNGAFLTSCLDEAACDTNGNVGQVVFQPMFDNWVGTVGTGFSKPLIGDAASAQLNLSVSAASNGLTTLLSQFPPTNIVPVVMGTGQPGPGLPMGSFGTLKVTLTEIDHMSPLGNLGFTSTVGGVWLGAVTYVSSLTDINGIQALTNAAFVGNPFFGAGQSGNATNVKDPFSLMVMTTLTAGAGMTNGSVDTTLDSIPEPGTLAIFGLGLVGLGFARRKKAA